MTENKTIITRDCACEVCQKAKEMVQKNHSHYICKPASALLDIVNGKPEDIDVCATCKQPHEHDPDCPSKGPNTTDTNIKRDLMREFSALYHKTTFPQNFSSMGQIDNSTIHVSLRQYPDQGETHNITIFDEFSRLRHFGWQLRYIRYDKFSTLHLYFEKVDWRSVNSYGLKPTKHNNEKDLWWLKPDAKPERKWGE